MNHVVHSEGLFLFILSIFTGFLAVVNPIVNTPVYMSLTDGMKEKEKKKVAKTAVLVAIGIMSVFTLGGSYIFQLFGLTVPAFKIAGGILIFYVGFEMVKSQRPHLKSHLEDPDTEDDAGIAISPLGTPLLAGPGAIITGLSFTTGGNFIDVVYTLLVYIIMVIFNYICFLSGARLMKLVGKDLIKVIGKIMGLILTVIGTGIIIGGLDILIKGWF